MFELEFRGLINREFDVEWLLFFFSGQSYLYFVGTKSMIFPGYGIFMLSSIFHALPDSDLRTISPLGIITGIAFNSESASAMDDIVIFRPWPSRTASRSAATTHTEKHVLRSSPPYCGIPA